MNKHHLVVYCNFVILLLMQAYDEGAPCRNRTYFVYLIVVRDYDRSYVLSIVDILPDCIGCCRVIHIIIYMCVCI